jgi:gamma-glutamyltranspeptidase
MIRRTRHVLAKQIGIVITALAVVAGLMSVGAAAQAVERPPMAGPPGVEITSPVVDDPVTGEAGTPATVSFTTNRAWPYIVDFRAAEVGDEWLPFADDTGSGTARAGDNEVEVEIPADLADGEYDVRVRILTPGGNPDRRQVMAEAEVESGLHVLPDAQPVVESVTVSPSAASLDVGDTAALSATARYDDESEQDVTAEAEWTSNDEAVASVDPEGLVTAVGAGTAEITATFEGAAGSATVTVDTSPDVFTTDFKEADQVAGEAPAGWTQLWGDGGFEIADAPRRVVHANTESGQGAIVFDAAGVIDYDVDAEVAGLVRLPAASNPSGTSTRFQMHLQASGDSGDHYSFYTDATGASVRLGRYLGGSYTGRGTAYSYAVPADAWHHVVMQRHDDVWRTKMWLYGEDEPADWMIETARTSIDGGLPAGQPGIGHFAPGAIHEWAWFSVAVGDDPADVQALRAPEGLFEPGPDADVTAVEVTPEEVTVQVDDTVDLGAMAVYDDGAGVDVTATADWAAADESVATVTADGVVTAVAEGSVEITATYEGVTGSAEVTVVDFLPPTTGFEDRDGAGWTTFDEEMDFLAEVAERSDRMSYAVVGETVEGRPLHLVRVGYPEAPSESDIAAGQSILVVGSQHGNEPAGREAALRHLRDLAFTEDPELLATLENITMLYVPTANPDGREANRRTNGNLVDTNRDHHLLETPEASAIADVVMRFDPEAVLDLHERPSGSNPDMELLWPRNLNVDEDLRQLNIELVEDYLFPALQDAGFTTGLYGSPTGAGGGDERISRNVFGLRHQLAVLTETGGQDPPMYRVDAQLLTVEETLAFFHERFTDVVGETTEAPNRRQAHGAEQGVFYLDGRDDVSPPPAEGIIDPGPCGYVLSAAEAELIERHLELFGIDSETLDDGRVFIGMDQPMMTMVPFFVDPRAFYNIANGLVVEDCDDIPDPVTPAQYSTSFTESEHTAGEPPVGWREFRTSGNWSVQDLPRRLEAQIASGGRQGLMWEEPGNLGIVEGDVEVAGLVRGQTTGNALFQITLHATGNGTDYYYVDAWPSNNNIRINRFVNNSFNTVQSASSGIEVDNGEWYQVVFRREGNQLSAKIWPFGADEPADWQVTTTEASHHSGQVGVTHLNEGTVNDWAWFSVGTGGLDAERAPADVFEPGADAELAEIAVSPESVILNPGGSAELSASAVWDDGNGVDVTTTADWASGDDQVATVTSDGVVTGVDEGDTEITATFEGVTGSASITVDPDYVDTEAGSHTFKAGQVTTAEGGMVSSADGLASSAGAQMLAAGGNAVDAAVATAFALTVVEPTMSHIGGRAQMMVRLPDGEYVALDGGTQVPADYDASQAPPSHEAGRGYGTIAVPGVVAALMDAHEAYGSLPMDAVMAPAIELATDGFALPARQANLLSEFALVDDPQYAAAQGYFLKADGSPYAAGDTLVQDDLAGVLAAIAESGSEVFYEGWIAEAIAADMAEFGGFVSAEELADYRTLDGVVVNGSYQGHDLYSMYNPARGQVTIQALQMMEHLDTGECASEEGWASVVHQAYRIGMADRNMGPELVTSPEHAEQRSADIINHCDPDVTASILNRTTASMSWPYMEEIDPEDESPDTTHLSTADPDGMAVTLTQTLGPGNGSMVATEGLGFLYASTMGYAGSTPGSRPSTNLTPMIVERDGELAYVLGAAGGGRIVTGVLLTLARMFDEDISLAEAMAAPRFHSTSDITMRVEFDPAAEVHWAPATLEGLQGYGYSVPTEPGSYYGRVHAVHYDADTGRFTGVADPRREGQSVGP